MKDIHTLSLLKIFSFTYNTLQVSTDFFFINVFIYAQTPHKHAASQGRGTIDITINHGITLEQLHTILKLNYPANAMHHNGGLFVSRGKPLANKGARDSIGGMKTKRTLHSSLSVSFKSLHKAT